VLDGPTATLGRSKECDCVIDDPNVSRKHAELRRSNVGDWQIVDLGSTNGVKVNGRRVANARLSPGDEITLGTKVFSFDIEQ
jgi:pSer/pThr/pTyr-binding forkhead associated (FHA) protein